MKVVKWIDVAPDSRSNEDDKRLTAEQPPSSRPTKRKVVETEPEPPHTVVPGSASELELLFTAKADYAKYQMNVNKIFFKDTLMFQTRMYR